VEGRLPSLSKQTVKWCLTDRSPFFYLLVDVARSVVDLYQRPHIDKKSIPPWMQRWLRQACTRLTREDVTSGNRLGLTPSHISNGFAWWSIMETLPHVYPGALSRPEYRYPFLDKQLVDYLFAVPREQILRPGYRRSLMRRSLRSIVPREILERRRKGYQIRGPLAALQQAYSKIDLILADALIGANGLIDPVQARFFLDLTNKGTEPKWWRALMRAINLELWLRGVGSSLTTNRIGSHSHRFLLANGGAK
jgi:asparagine synthase (glutamine-hydrolysing)